MLIVEKPTPPARWSPFVEFVRRHDRFLITTHTRPDGDALGSLLALAAALETKGKQVRRVIPSPLPPRYAFMDPDRCVEAFEKPGNHLKDCDAVIVVDTGTWNQLAGVGEVIRSMPAERFVIDHHPTQDDLGATRIVDTSAEACGRLIVEAIAALGVPLTPGMAHDLFIALAMDTGWFRHSNATAAAFQLAARLIDVGVRPYEIYERLYESDTPARLRLAGLVLERLSVLAEGRVAFSEVRWADYAATGAQPMDTEDLINHVRSLAGVEIAVFFVEQRDGQVKVSFRARPGRDVAKVAERFGGGGHVLASGATLPGPFETAKERALAAAIEAAAAGG